MNVCCLGVPCVLSPFVIDMDPGSIVGQQRADWVGASVCDSVMSPGVRDLVTAERTMTMAKIAGLNTDGSKVEKV